MNFYSYYLAMIETSPLFEDNPVRHSQIVDVIYGSNLQEADLLSVLKYRGGCLQHNPKWTAGVVIQ